MNEKLVNKNLPLSPVHQTIKDMGTLWKVIWEKDSGEKVYIKSENDGQNDYEVLDKIMNIWFRDIVVIDV